MCVGEVLGASVLRLIVQMDDLYQPVYLFCGKATTGDLLFPGVAEFFTLLHIVGTIFHLRTPPDPQTDLFTDSPLLYTHILRLAYIHKTYTGADWRSLMHIQGRRASNGHSTLANALDKYR